MKIAATNTNIYTSLYSAGTNICQNTRSSHFSPVNQALTDITLLYGNWYVTNTGGTGILGLKTEVNGSNNIDIRASIEYPVGIFTPATINGYRDVAIGAGFNGSLKVQGIYIPPNTQFWVRTLVNTSPTTSQYWPNGVPCNSGLGEGAIYNTSYDDRTLTGTITANTNPGFAPLAILDGSANIKRSFLIIGDSIQCANNEGGVDAGDAYGNYGFVARGIRNLYGYSRMADGTDGYVFLADYYGNSTNFMRRMDALLPYITDVVFAMGTNDIQGVGNGGTVPPLASVQTNAMAAWDLFDQHGITVHVCTIGPHTTSTDNWITPQNQTPVAAESIRPGFNNWVRSKPKMLSGHCINVIETADAFEEYRDSGIYKVNGVSNATTPDGAHPSSLMAANIAAVVQEYISSL